MLALYIKHILLSTMSFEFKDTGITNPLKISGSGKTKFRVNKKSEEWDHLALIGGDEASLPLICVPIFWTIIIHF